MKTFSYTAFVLVIVLCLMLGCVQDTHKKTLTISVDMSQQTYFESVGIRGNLKPLSWEENTLLNDPDGDGIYEVALELDTASDYLQFKFVKNEDEFELDGKDNRLIKFEYRPEALSYSAVFDQN